MVNEEERKKRKQEELREQIRAQRVDYPSKRIICPSHDKTLQPIIKAHVRLEIGVRIKVA